MKHWNLAQVAKMRTNMNTMTDVSTPSACVTALGSLKATSCFLIAVAMFAMGAAQTGGSIVENAVKLPPDMTTEARARLAIADTYHEAGVTALRAGDFATAERAARNGLAIVPESVHLLFLYGEALIRLGKNAEALRIWQDISFAHEQGVIGSHLRGGAFARVGLLLARMDLRNKSATMASPPYLDRVLPQSLKGTVGRPSVNRRDLEVYWLTAIGLEAELYADDEECLYYFGSAIKLQPSAAIPNYRLGAMFLRKKQYDEALARFDSVKAWPAGIASEVREMRAIAVGKARRAG